VFDNREIYAIVLKMSDKLTITVEVDQTLLNALEPFDYKFDGTSTFDLPNFDAPKRDGSWAIGLIVGPSGTGKSQLLKKHYGITPDPTWDGKKGIASQVPYQKLGAVGLNSVPSWCRPYHVLSNGEQFRARMAAMLDTNTSFDEFTSVVDRTIAKSCSHALQRQIRNDKLTGVVFATCHYDITEWLQPDWVFDTLTSSLTVGRSLWRRPDVHLSIERCDKGWWSVFKKHHYLSDDLNKSSRCYLAKWNGNPVGFVSVLPMPSGTLKNAWREHRVVVFPDYQGVGIGVRLSDAIAQMYVDEGKRYYSKTAHPRMGEYRNRSKLWKPTVKNMKTRQDYKAGHDRKYSSMAHADRLCYSHEYINKS
jgi:GNAT superfamily N-acetyltransferase